jgi:hypothetical protein
MEYRKPNEHQVGLRMVKHRFQVSTKPSPSSRALLLTIHHGHGPCPCPRCPQPQSQRLSKEIWLCQLRRVRMRLCGYLAELFHSLLLKKRIPIPFLNIDSGDAVVRS